MQKKRSFGGNLYELNGLFQMNSKLFQMRLREFQMKNKQFQKKSKEELQEYLAFRRRGARIESKKAYNRQKAKKEVSRNGRTMDE